MDSKPEVNGAGAASGQHNAEEMSFQDMLNQLEQIVNELESGELSLEQSLAKFEEGVRLARKLESILSRTEMRIQQILRSEDTQEIDAEEIHELEDPCN